MHFPSPTPTSREPSSAPIHFPLQSLEPPLRDEGAGGGALVAPGGGQVADLAVVPREAVDTGLDENEAVLGVLVLAVALEVLADSDGLEKVSWRCERQTGKRFRGGLTFLIRL